MMNGESWSSIAHVELPEFTPVNERGGDALVQVNVGTRSVRVFAQQIKVG
jgi:hypothetical protein